MRFSIFLIFQIFFVFCAIARAQEKPILVEIPNSLFSESDPLAKIEENPDFTANPARLTVRVNPAPFTEWDLNSNLERIQKPEFLGQFSMKRGYRLEPFLRDLKPEIATRMQCDIFQTVHEFYCESVLAPAQVWCREHGATLQFRISPLAGQQNVSMILDEAQFATEIYVDDFQNIPAVRLAAGVVLSRGYLYVLSAEKKISYRELFRPKQVILLPESQTYDFSKEPESYQTAHFITENELEYATIIRKYSNVILGVGACEYEILIVHPDSEKVYRPGTVRILNRFRAELLKFE